MLCRLVNYLEYLEAISRDLKNKYKALPKSKSEPRLPKLNLLSDARNDYLTKSQKINWRS